QFIAELNHAIATETSSRDALPAADSLIADGALEDAALLLDRTLSARGQSRQVLLSTLQKRGVVATRAGQIDLARETFARLANTKALAISHTPPKNVPAGQSARIQVQLSSDPLGLMSHFVVYYRIAGRNEYSSVRARRDAGNIEIAPALLASPPRG